MTADAYLIGRRSGDLKSITSQALDYLYVGQRLDDETLTNQTFEHCTFANISFKKGILENCRFIDCVFIDCYFRDTQIKDCSFSSSKFIDCNFTKVDMRATDFRWYNSFSGCYLPYQTVMHCLPAEGNLKNHLCSNLANEALNAGEWADSQSFRQAAAAGKEQDLKAILRRSNDFYKEKYNGQDQINAAWAYLGSRAHGRIWGYSRSHYVLMRNWALFTFLIFPWIFIAFGDSIQYNNHPVNFIEAEIASAGNMMPGSSISSVKFTSVAVQSVAFVEAFIGLSFVGLAVSLLFSAVDRKRG